MLFPATRPAEFMTPRRDYHLPKSWELERGFCGENRGCYTPMCPCPNPSAALLVTDVGRRYARPSFRVGLLLPTIFVKGPLSIPPQPSRWDLFCVPSAMCAQLITPGRVLSLMFRCLLSHGVTFLCFCHDPNVALERLSASTFMTTNSLKPLP